jgi:phage shock protein PspC (stress-responsive transcriptional regulator)
MYHIENSTKRKVIHMQKKLYRVNEGKMIAGVCAGLAEYLDIDATVIRLIWALIGLSGAGLIAYLIAALIIPVKPLGIEE